MSTDQQNQGVVIDASCHFPRHQSQFPRFLLSVTSPSLQAENGWSGEVVKEAWSSFLHPSFHHQPTQYGINVSPSPSEPCYDR
ncbi:hypothetical protein CesoFtcFv8_008957 [Champsocephalus esox]|uniref:Uncharacterized protein n=1 Tax=Champsocephalus esox TaxID=159716 RepID=A0AAN8C9K7_9TELE|nr:hypothetical protein CesoFtcFv8_008957 [Champsocephalus esox]